MFVLLAVLFAVNGMAQVDSIAGKDSMDVAFAIVIPAGNTLTSAQRKEIRLKLETVLARTKSAGEVKKTPFVIVPELRVLSTDVTAGAKETFTLVEGELTLTVKNRYNGTAYNELVMPLKEMVAGKRVADPVSVLIRKIEPKDRRFVRFINTSQKRIAEHYAGGAVEVP